MAARTALTGLATLLCGTFGLGVVALSSGPSAAATTATLFVDNVNGTQTTGCTSSGRRRLRDDPRRRHAAEALTDTAVTLDVAGSATTYDEMVAINLPSSAGDTLDIEGTGSTLPTLDDGGSGSNITIADTSVGAVTIDNMTISGGSGTGTAVVRSTTSGPAR